MHQQLACRRLSVRSRNSYISRNFPAGVHVQQQERQRCRIKPLRARCSMTLESSPPMGTTSSPGLERSAAASPDNMDTFQLSGAAAGVARRFLKSICSFQPQDLQQNESQAFCIRFVSAEAGPGVLCSCAPLPHHDQGTGVGASFDELPPGLGGVPTATCRSTRVPPEK